MSTKGWVPGKTNKSIIGSLVEELRKDQSEGSYYHGWKANIAMAFQDEYNFENKRYSSVCHTQEEIHKLSNDAADRFLQQLIAE